jgi:hypothetical protein
LYIVIPGVVEGAAFSKQRPKWLLAEKRPFTNSWKAQQFQSDSDQAILESQAECMT